MASIIDNKRTTLLEELQASLKKAERIDILTAYFYFSGFDALAEDLRDKKIRILVGNTIDPSMVSKLCLALKSNPNKTLERYCIEDFDTYSNSEKMTAYTDAFVEMFNRSTLSDQFDSSKSQEVFKMFLSKIKDGTLEIRITPDSEVTHSKAFIVTNDFEYSNFGLEKGVVYMGSSNMTYNGLIGQRELDEKFTSNEKYDEYLATFEEQWYDSRAVDVCVADGNDDFIKQIENRLWLFAKPTPYQIFVRVLYEMYGSLENEEIKSPDEITRGKFSNFKYQLDAVKIGVDCIKKNNGVIIADVVGLGKSVIASAIAYNLDMPKVVIIAPPHLTEQWNEYQQEFGLRGARVFSSGKIDEIYQTYSSDPTPILYIIDEAHRYRNELSDTYQQLHQLTRSSADNKVILLTATPYNNKPQDLFALIKLFQTPNRSTLQSATSLGHQFRELIARYNSLSKNGKKNLTPEIKAELDKLSRELRTLIEPVVVRRSRLDLQEISEYAEDLRTQKIQFPTVVGPELVEYDLGNLRELYLSTLDDLSNNFRCARYSPTEFLINPDAFLAKYGEIFNEMNLQQSQRNLADFIRRLLVMRFESSKAAFKATLESILNSYENIIKWWNKGYVPIKKSGYLPDPDDYDIQETLDEIQAFVDAGTDTSKIRKLAIPIETKYFRIEYIAAVRQDLALLKKIFSQWFGVRGVGEDPKYDTISDKIRRLLKDNPKRKIVVFSSFADTASYVAKKMIDEGFRTFLYTGGASKTDRAIVRSNFDASVKPSAQANDYDIIVATDALSEGFNLNRAGVIINYDIPYNPTRVVQRIGRINRINKKMFDSLYIFNFFPTDIGEDNTFIKGISTLKMFLINNIVGSDTKTLTPDETLESYFKDRYNEADEENNDRSWDNKYRNIYNSIRHNLNLFREVMDIPERARIVRVGDFPPCAVSFAKRGSNMVFAMATDYLPNAELIPAERALPLFYAEVDEPAYDFDSSLDQRFEILRQEIQKPYQKVRMDARRTNAIENLQQLLAVCPFERNYLNDLIDTIKTYDDLSDGEIKYLANLIVKPVGAREMVAEIKEKIPSHYLNQIKKRVVAFDMLGEIIIFTEDFRNDNN